jgi:hypothetical protein
MLDPQLTRQLCAKYAYMSPSATLSPQPPPVDDPSSVLPPTATCRRSNYRAKHYNIMHSSAYGIGINVYICLRVFERQLPCLATSVTSQGQDILALALPLAPALPSPPPPLRRFSRPSDSLVPNAYTRPPPSASITMHPWARRLPGAMPAKRFRCITCS